MAQKNLGKPKIVILYVWDVYMMQKGREAVPGQMDERFHREREAAGQAPITGRPPMVTLWDPASGDCKKIFTGHTNGVRGVALDAGGQLAP